MFFAAVASAYGCALLLSLAVEMPVMHFDKFLFGPGGGGSQRFQSRSAAGTLDGGGKSIGESQKNGKELAGQGQELKKLLMGDGKEEKPIEELEEEEQNGQKYSTEKV
jgi:hypothetical protein